MVFRVGACSLVLVSLFMCGCATVKETKRPKVIGRVPTTPVAGPRVWAILTNGKWARWSPENNWWEPSKVTWRQIAGDPVNGGACYYIDPAADPDTCVRWRDEERNLDSTFAGLRAKQISVGAEGELWAIQDNDVWARWSDVNRRWDRYSEVRSYIAADPDDKGACYFIDDQGVVGWRNVDRNENKTFPGIQAKQISVGGGAIWAIQTSGRWARWSAARQEWDRYSETPQFIVADPTTSSACFFIKPDGTVAWRNVDQNMNMDFAGIEAREIAVSGR